MRKFGSVGVVAALALVLSGCTGTTPEPSESPSASSVAPSSSAPASPTPKPATSTSPAENIEPPEMPDLAKEFSAEGYEAFVKYWFEARNYAASTGDVKPMTVVSHEKCGYCSKHQTAIEQIYGQGGWIVGGEQVPTNFFTNFREVGDGFYHAMFTLRQKNGNAYDANGGVDDSQTLDDGEYPYTFVAIFDEEDGWQAALIDIDSEED